MRYKHSVRALSALYRWLLLSQFLRILLRTAGRRASSHLCCGYLRLLLSFEEFVEVVCVFGRVDCACGSCKNRVSRQCLLLVVWCSAGLDFFLCAAFSSQNEFAGCYFFIICVEAWLGVFSGSWLRVDLVWHAGDVLLHRGVVSALAYAGLRALVMLTTKQVVLWDTGGLFGERVVVVSILTFLNQGLLHHWCVAFGDTQAAGYQRLHRRLLIQFIGDLWSRVVLLSIRNFWRHKAWGRTLLLSKFNHCGTFTSGTCSCHLMVIGSPFANCLSCCVMRSACCYFFATRTDTNDTCHARISYILLVRCALTFNRWSSFKRGWCHAANDRVKSYQVLKRVHHGNTVQFLQFSVL